MTTDSSTVRRSRARILFFAEEVTLAHIARPLALARTLDRSEFEIHFASAGRYENSVGACPYPHWKIDTITNDAFLSALAAGRPIYSRRTLEGYVREDIRVINEVKPHLIVGDFRLSLAVSGVVAAIPYAAITNAHWSPFAQRAEYPFPEHPLGRALGVPLANWMFRRTWPLVFRYHGIPMNSVRRQYGLPRLGDLRHVYTHGDYVLYADVPELAPTASLPANHEYIGPIVWSPSIPKPDWWARLPLDRPIVYVTLGTSGQTNVIPEVLAQLGALPVTVLFAGAGRMSLEKLPSNVFSADYLPGDKAARLARLVICNGGSATAYQALSQGAPVLGIPSNMDQHLTMDAIRAGGAGLVIRSDMFSRDRFRTATRRILADESFSKEANKIASHFAQVRPEELFPRLVRRALAEWPGADQTGIPGTNP